MTYLFATIHDKVTEQYSHYHSINTLVPLPFILWSSEFINHGYISLTDTKPNTDMTNQNYTSKNFHIENPKEDSQLLKMGLIGCPKMSERKYHDLLHNNPEECSSHLFCGRSLKSRIQLPYYLSINLILLLTIQEHCIPVNEAETHQRITRTDKRF